MQLVGGFPTRDWPLSMDLGPICSNHQYVFMGEPYQCAVVSLERVFTSMADRDQGGTTSRCGLLNR